MKNENTVVVMCNENTIPYVSATVSSLMSNVGDSFMNLFLLCNSLSQFSKKGLELLYKKASNVKVTMIDVNCSVVTDYFFSEEKQSGFLTVDVCKKFLQEYSRALVLQAGVIVLQDISLFFPFNMQDRTIAAFSKKDERGNMQILSQAILVDLQKYIHKDFGGSSQYNLLSEKINEFFKDDWTELDDIWCCPYTSMLDMVDSFHEDCCLLWCDNLGRLRTCHFFQYYLRKTIWYESCIKDYFQNPPKRKSIFTKAVKKLFPPKTIRGELLYAFFKAPKRIYLIAYQIKSILRVKSMKFANFNPFSCALGYKKNIEQYKNLFSGKRCFVIGLGPSLQIEDLEMLKNETTFALNNVFQLFDKTEWRPTFYIYQELISKMGNEAFQIFDKNISQYQMSQMFLPYSKFIKDIKKKLPKTKIDVLPIEIDWSLYSGDDENIQFSSDISKKVVGAYTTVYSIFQIALYMGFSEIYLLGVDCEYRVGKRHCYNSENESAHLDFDNEKKCAQDTRGVGRGYYKIHEKTKHIPNLKIYNATRGGKLECFERVNLDDIINQDND